MFMGKDDIKNTLTLTKIKLGISSSKMLKESVIILFVYPAILLPNLVTVLKYKDTVVDIRIFDYSIYFFIGIVISSIVMNIIYKYSNDSLSVLTFVEAGPPRMLDSVWMDRTITLDTSAYEDLSSIRIETNIKESDNIHISKALPAVKKDKIIVQYRLPVRITNDYNLIEVTNPKFSATLEDSTLSIQYNYDKNVKVLFISPWFMMRQFERYQDKNLYSDSPDFYYSNSYSNGYVNIFPQ